MENSLAPEYIAFIDNGGKLSVLTQEIIDRIQYHPGFLEFVQLLLTEYDAPFEWANTENGRVRQIKQSFLKTEQNEQTGSIHLPDTRGEGNGSVQGVDISGWRDTPEVEAAADGRIE